MRRWAVLLLALFACYHAAPPTASSVTSPPSRSADSLALRARMDGWWPALMAADTAFFDSVLAPSFVQQRTKMYAPVINRAEYLSMILWSPACGPEVTYQVILANYELLGDYALSTQTVRLSDGDPVTWQNEFQYVLLFGRQDGKWMALQSWHYGHELGPGDRVGRGGWAEAVGADTSYRPAEHWKQVKGPCPKYEHPPWPAAKVPVVPVKPTIYVRAIDTTTGRPLVMRTSLDEFPTHGVMMYDHQGRADSTGLIRLDTVSTRTFTLNCGGKKMFGLLLATLDSAQTARALAGDTVLLRVDGSKCNQRKIDTARAVFTGHYTAGFEESDLKLCSDSTRRIWVTFSTHAVMPKGFKWPKPNDKYYPRYFVQLEGRMLGPDSYGHMGMADYLLFVDSLVFARRPTKRDCD